MYFRHSIQQRQKIVDKLIQLLVIVSKLYFKILQISQIYLKYPVPIINRSIDHFLFFLLF
jgi:hypothetical protein